MSNLKYRNPNHNQEAELYIGDRLIARFSATVDGTNLPTYSAWLATDVTEEDYQAHHETIHEAYIEFVQKQSVNEAKLIDRIQADKEAVRPEEPSTVDEPSQPEPRVDEPAQSEPRAEEPGQPEVNQSGDNTPEVEE